MDGYIAGVERLMKRLFDSLNEGDRRRYAAIEATKLGHDGVEYISALPGCDPRTILRSTTATLAARDRAR